MVTEQLANSLDMPILRVRFKSLTETNVLPDELLREYQLDLLALQNKHIPAEICSSGKLIERIGEVTTLIDNVKWEVDSLNKSNS